MQSVSPTEIRRSQTLPALVLGFGLSVMGVQMFIFGTGFAGVGSGSVMREEGLADVRV